jgi:thiamine biosynthesis lipoprotein ApbE
LISSLNACAYSSLSEGAFDITVGPLDEGLGLLSRRGRMPSEQELSRRDRVSAIST